MVGAAGVLICAVVICVHAVGVLYHGIVLVIIITKEQFFIFFWREEGVELTKKLKHSHPTTDLLTGTGT